jgi:hypothetical protein
MERCYITVEFTRDLNQDKKAGINPLSHIALEGVIRRDYDLEALTVTEHKILSTPTYRVTAELPVFPEQGDSVSTLLAYKLLHLQRQAIKGNGSFDFVVASISLSEKTYQAGDVLNAMKEDRTLAFSKLNIAMEDGVEATKRWLIGLILFDNKGTSTVTKDIRNLLALMEPSVHLQDGDKPSQEPGFSNTDLAIHKTLQAHAPKVLEAISDQWLTFSGRAIWNELSLVKERLNRLNHLHLSRPQNYEVDGADVTALVEKFTNSDQASITDNILRDLLDQHDPDTTEGRAFRRGLLIASQLALENNQKRKGAASLELLHSDLTSSLTPSHTLTM